MPNKTLIKQLLHVKKIVIDSYKYSDEDDEFTISVHPTKGQQCLCPECRKKCPYYDSLGTHTHGDRWTLDLRRCSLKHQCTGSNALSTVS